ncbi:D-isomer specific 2-hydroxyacid dehydrogenase NAD-binding protein [Halogeometricum pallidum JCM 14848]|uniref:D-isomer specific 2-hydroxyacid dehydrogenase NAD-binding protein n=1 Tax=Halogeometricum pallidum JCM 14848 TaxID=1227487 RepID=M0D9D3_HALPD|nr:D-2-hydroxyacid dehydrogenase [Halogeometricum pallidum]ELZ31433.1 D-isomer specific 2-hydroxyacid dehydrogenase NAD-binding protein [Halogeometricum pallidum JCM 14848]
MPTAVIYHDTPIASTVEDLTDDPTVVAAESDADVRDHLADADIFVTNPNHWRDDFLDSLSAGTWIQSTSIGYDAFPVDEFADRDVTFTNAETLHDTVVSEHAFALMFALSRRLGPVLDNQRRRDWDRSVGAEMWLWEGTQMTVFGLGNIGESIARRARAFGFEVFGVKRTPSIYSGVLTGDRVVATEQFHELLPETDLLVLTVPLTDETHHAIDASVFSALPDSAVVVNVARGPVVDQDALLAALETGELRGAGLDVFEDEPLPRDSPLWERDDTVVTPHVGGRSEDFAIRFARLFLDNYRRWRDGESLANRIV